ncbi:NAD(P)H-hydrate dehydratase [Nesterenkonia natronophila]|nr:NAD(P)H-hydrate dehydratase [Nesterenkonia natronophila]
MLVNVYTGDQIRAAEKPLLDTGYGPALMGRAAYGLAHHIAHHHSSARGRGLYGARITALIGPGNNGGDGLYALAHLARRGAAVAAVLTRDRAHPEGLQAFRAAGGRVVDHIPPSTEVLVDAVVGTGFRGDFVRPQVPGLEILNDDAALRPLVVACDLPSGVNADTGAAGEGVIAADLSVTFGGMKQGLIAGRGGTLSGMLHTVPIGLERHLPKTPVRLTSVQEPTNVSSPLPTDHKYSRGVLHLVAGSSAFPGAALLTAGAAVSTGVGMVVLQAPEAVRSRVISAYPEVVGVPPSSTPAAMDRSDGVVIGPGLGDQPQLLSEAEAVLEHVLESGTACVLDASGLGLIRDQLRRRGGLSTNVLITPHVGEARRIAVMLRDRVLASMLDSGSAKADPVEAARRVAGSLDCSVLLKGSTTVVASPQGEVLLHRAQAPGLATAGTGDVLSGILGALCATQEQDWLTVAAQGVSMHTAAVQRIDPEGRGRFGASAVVRAMG